MFNSKPNISAIIELTRLNKPIGIYLLLWPTLTALWLAKGGLPSFGLIAIFTAGVIITRSAGCVINDLADRNIDALVLRSCNRPLVTNKISKTHAIIVFCSLIIMALGLVSLTNLLTITLALIAGLLMVIYPFMKRYTNAPQLFLGLAFASAIPMAFAAQNNALNIASFWFFGFVVIWAIAYDTMYAMVDKEYDLKIGVKSTAILFAPYERLGVGILQFIMLICLFIVGLKFQMSWLYYLGIVATLPFMIYQQWLIKNHIPKFCLKAFFNNHYLGLVIFIATALSYQI